MASKFFLVILFAYVLKWIGTIAVSKYIQTGKTNEQLTELRGFHISVITYMVGTVLKYIGWALLFACLVKDYILT